MNEYSIFIENIMYEDYYIKIYFIKKILFLFKNKTNIIN